MNLINRLKKAGKRCNKYWKLYPKDVWVNTYYKSRSFGGEEEGGWYYTNYELVEANKYPSAFMAFKAMASINNERHYVSFCESTRAASEDISRHIYQ